MNDSVLWHCKKWLKFASLYNIDFWIKRKKRDRNRKKIRKLYRYLSNLHNGSTIFDILKCGKVTLAFFFLFHFSPPLCIAFWLCVLKTFQRLFRLFHVTTTASCVEILQKFWNAFRHFSPSRYFLLPFWWGFFSIHFLFYQNITCEINEGLYYWIVINKCDFDIEKCHVSFTSNFYKKFFMACRWENESIFL